MHKLAKMGIGGWVLIAAWIVVLIAGFRPLNAMADEQSVTVFAAASTTNAVTDIAKMFEASHPVKVLLSFASSSTLAKQIGEGAPADVFLSANPQWMDYLAEKNEIVPESRVDLLSNRIVLIAPKDSPVDNVAVDSALDMAGLLKGGYLAMGDPDHVPAGKYGKQAFEKLGLWAAIQDRIARAKDVRAALTLVERAESPLGQVYATDAAISDKVKVVGVFPEDSHPPITYPAALIAGKDNAAARDFLVFLRGPDARAVFEKYGFSVR